ncbi:MAG: chromosome segregation protein SMC [Bacillaceae bacterium]|nr:chromosome segregation protein SMC [Bacillaceae bacterium]
MSTSVVDSIMEERQRLIENWQDATEEERKQLLIRIMDLDEEIELLKEKEEA